MKIYFVDPAVFADRAAFRALLRLFIRFFRGQHQPIFGDADAFLASPFFAAGLPLDEQPATREFAARLAYEELLTDRAADPIAHTRPTALHVEVTPKPGPALDACLWSLTPDDAAAWAEGALTVLIENDNDAALLRGAARAYGYRRLLDAAAEHPPWLHFDGRGGHGELPRKVGAAHALARLFVITDRDDPNDPPRQIAHARLSAACAARQPLVGHHVWLRRNIESYLPLAFLRRRADRSAALLATLDRLQALGDALADEDIKKHLKPKVRRAALAACDAHPPPFTADELDAHAGDELRILFDRLEELL